MQGGREEEKQRNAAKGEEAREQEVRAEVNSNLGNRTTTNWGLLSRILNANVLKLGRII